MRLSSNTVDLVAALARLGVELSPGASADRRDLLDLLVTHAIDALGAGRVFITDYPADQAALARLVQDSEGRGVAARFELIIDGVEVANGYDELVDADVHGGPHVDRSSSCAAPRVATNPRTIRACLRRCATVCRAVPALRSASID